MKPFTLKALFATLLLANSLLPGCAKPVQEFPPKAPRPVTAMELRKFTPESSFAISGSVKSWKTEQIGFEVSGRIQWVLEPGKNIAGRVIDSEGILIREGTPLASIDPAHYEVAVQSALASLDAAKLEAEIIVHQIESSIPADIRSALADATLADTEFARMKRLTDQRAASQSEYDSAATRVATQQARLANLESGLQQSKVELKAAQARVNSAEQTLQDARRDLDHTTLYASYPGQISEVQVVPGSVVTAGSPVLTLQMMNPIKVEIEVSAEQSRALERRRQVPVSFVTPDGEHANRNAMVYNVGPSADVATRTFSTTLLMMNEQRRQSLAHWKDSDSFARAQNLWPMNLSEMIGAAAEVFVVEEDSIEQDAEGSFVYFLTNARHGQQMPDVVKVRKHRVTVLDSRIPFLGNWIFRPVLFANSNDPDHVVDRETILVGKLEFPDGDRANWDGQSVVVDSGPQWMLRPGDLVTANLADRQPQHGYFVPIEAIYEESGRTYVFVIDGAIARQTEVIAELPETLDTGSLLQIQPTANGEFADGTQIVVRGVHFLLDGESVKIITSELPEEAQSLTQIAEGESEIEASTTKPPVEGAAVGQPTTAAADATSKSTGGRP